MIGAIIAAGDNIKLGRRGSKYIFYCTCNNKYLHVYPMMYLNFRQIILIFCSLEWMYGFKASNYYWHISRGILGVPRRQPHRRSGLATLPSVGAVP